VIVHGDTEGAAGVRRSLSDWLCDMQLEPAEPLCAIDRYIGYWQPYATSHATLDLDQAVQDEVRNGARVLLESVLARRSGQLSERVERWRPPRQK